MLPRPTTSRLRHAALATLALSALALAFFMVQSPSAWAGTPELPPQGKQLGFNDDMAPARHGITTWDYVELSRAAGGNAVRSAIDWRAAEPAEGEWDEGVWTAWRKLYDDARFQGLTPIFVIGFAPSWAREESHQACDQVGACELPPAPEMDWAWARFAAEVATRFPEAAIQLWNEPNLKIYWETEEGPDPERFAELLDVGAEAIRKASPTTRIVSGGVANLEQTGQYGMALGEFMDRLLEALPALPDIVDEVGIHVYPYSAQIGEGTLFDRSMKRARRALADAGHSGAPLAITETGVSRGPPEALSAAQQADATMRIVRELLGAPDVATVILHRAIEPLDTSANPWEHGTGLVAYGAEASEAPEPYPAFCALVKAAEASYPGCAGERGAAVELGFDDGRVFGAGATNLPLRLPHFRTMLFAQVNGGEWELTGLPVRLETMAEGKHEISVRAVEPLAEWSATSIETRSFEIDRSFEEKAPEPAPEPVEPPKAPSPPASEPPVESAPPPPTSTEPAVAAAAPQLSVRVSQRLGVAPFSRSGPRVRAATEEVERVALRLAVTARAARRAGIVPRGRKNPVFLARGATRVEQGGDLDVRVRPSARAGRALERIERGTRMEVRVEARGFGPGGDAIERQRMHVARPD